MGFCLIQSGSLHRCVIQPEVRNVKAREHAIRCGFPGDAEQDLLACEGFLPIGRPYSFGNQLRDREAFAATPDAGGGIEGHFFFGGLTASSVFRFKGGDDHPFVVLEFHFLKFPDPSFALAVTGFIFEQEDVVFGGQDTGTTIVIGVPRLVVDGQHRHGRNLRIGREIGEDVQHGAERDVAQIGRCTMIAHEAVGQQGEGVWVVAKKHAGSLHPDAAAAVRMVDEHEFTPVGIGFFQRGKFSRFGPENLGLLFLVLCFGFFAEGGGLHEKTRNQQ